MDWADDVAYSVHDLEDGLHAGLITMARLRDQAERAAVAELAQAHYSARAPPAWPSWLRFSTDLLELDCWPGRFDGGRPLRRR